MKLSRIMTRNCNGQYFGFNGQYFNRNGQYLPSNGQYFNCNGQYVQELEITPSPKAIKTSILAEKPPPSDSFRDAETIRGTLRQQMLDLLGYSELYAVLAVFILLTVFYYKWISSKTARPEAQ